MLEPTKSETIITVKPTGFSKIHPGKANLVARTGLRYDVEIRRNDCRDLRIPTGGLLNQEYDQAAVRRDLDASRQAGL